MAGMGGKLPLAEDTPQGIPFAWDGFAGSKQVSISYLAEREGDVAVRSALDIDGRETFALERGGGIFCVFTFDADARTDVALCRIVIVHRCDVRT
jgi:hypothetical protein